MKILELELSLDWSEMDVFGHINNVAYFKYLQAARVKFWEEMGLLQNGKPGQVGPMLASAKCDFRRPLQYPGMVTIKTGVGFIKNSSFGPQHHLYNSNGNEYAEGDDVCVFYDFENRQKQERSLGHRQFLESFSSKI